MLSSRHLVVSKSLETFYNLSRGSSIARTLRLRRSLCWGEGANQRMDRRVGSRFNQKDTYQRWHEIGVEIQRPNSVSHEWSSRVLNEFGVRKALDSSVINYTHSQLTYEQWATVLSQITYLINSRPLYPEDNPEDFNCITGNNLLYPFGQVFVVQPPNDERVNPRDMMKVAEKQVAKFWDIWMRHIPPQLLLPNRWFKSRDKV